MAALDRVETVSRTRDQRSQLTAAKFRVLTGSLKSLLGQGCQGCDLFCACHPITVHTVANFDKFRQNGCADGCI